MAAMAIIWPIRGTANAVTGREAQAAQPGDFHTRHVDDVGARGVLAEAVASRHHASARSTPCYRRRASVLRTSISASVAGF